MKKILLIIVSFFILPLVVFADAGAPSIRSYEARIINQSGVKATKYDWKTKKDVEIVVPYDAIVTVDFEYEEKGVLYGEFSYNKNNEYYSGKIAKSDYRIVTDTFKPTEEFKRSGGVYVYKEGAYLYKGPSKAYDKASDTMIPVGTVLEFSYAENYFAYVTYNGVSGWVYTAEEGEVYKELSSVALKVNNGKIHTFSSVDILKEPSKTSAKVGSIPSEKDVVYSYDFNTDYTEGLRSLTYVYVEYNGVTGWVLLSKNVGIPFKGLIYSYDEESLLCASFDKYECKKDVTIPKKTLLISDYRIKDEHEVIIRFNYNNQLLYSNYSWDEEHYAAVSYLHSFNLSKEASCYDTFNGNKLDSTQPVGKFEGYEYRSGWFYIPSKGVWIKAQPGTVTYSDDEVVYFEDDDPISEPTNPDKPTEDSPVKEVIPTKQIVIYSVLGSLILVLVIIIIILLVNRKPAAPATEPKKTEEEAKLKKKTNKKE